MTCLRFFKLNSFINQFKLHCYEAVGLSRFELKQTEPKSVVLPLHHSPIIT